MIVFAMKRKIRMGMVGGGRGAFIGAVHRMAAGLDGAIELVCGCFSSDPKKSRDSGADLFLPPDRVYGTFQEMFRAEKALPEGERMDFASIVTPNNLHFPAAKAALESGFSVMCDKPMTLTLAEAKSLRSLVEKTGLGFGLTHNYTGYPMVKEARRIVSELRLGAVRKIVVEYPQGWLSTPVEMDGNKAAQWRMDPARGGLSSVMGDIGSHCENLVEYVTGLRIAELCADLTVFVAGRTSHDDGSVLLRMEGGARGVLHASQISAGEENSLAIRVYGGKGGLEGHQMEPNTLIHRRLDGPAEILRTGSYSWLSDRTVMSTRLPPGHPEGFIEAFANLYRNFALCLSARLEGREPKPEHLDVPTVTDGVRGMAFIETVVESAKNDRKWTAMKG
jgi:predicted dehydrogenase